MKYIVQSCSYGDDKWSFRKESKDALKILLELEDVMKGDRRWKSSSAYYRIIDNNEKVVFVKQHDNV
jgi:hypothetical protein